MYDRVLNENIDSKVPIADKVNNTIIYIPFQVDFTERIYEVRCFKLDDLMALIGGLKSFLLPFLTFFSPFFVIIFLNFISKALKEKFEYTYN